MLPNIRKFAKKIAFLKKVRNRIDYIINPLIISQYTLKKIMIKQSIYAKGLLLDIGSGSKPYQNIFKTKDYISLDLPNNAEADIQADGLSLPIKDSCFDTVISNEVLEHVERPQGFMEEVYRVLKPGGILILTTPQTWGLHHEPHDYYRYTKYGLRYLSETVGFKVIDIQSTTGFIPTFIQRMVDTLLHHYLKTLPKFLKYYITIICAPILWFGILVNRFGRKFGDTLDNVIVAQKPKNF